jgi:hypothetical protein
MHKVLLFLEAERLHTRAQRVLYRNCIKFAKLETKNADSKLGTFLSKLLAQKIRLESC